MELFIKFMGTFFSSFWNWGFIVLFVGAVAFFIRSFFHKIDEANALLKESRKKLENYNTENIHFYFESLNQTMGKDVFVGAVWKKYVKTLIRDTHLESIHIYSTVDASDYFNVASLTGKMNIGYWSGFAGVFTGIGILGTFLGLTVGLASIDTGSTNALSSSISALLGGMSTAFVTSLFGIVLAIPSGYYYSERMNAFGQEVSRFSDQIDAIFVRKNVEEIMLDQVAESRAQRAAIEGLSTDIADAICEQLPDVLGRIADRVDESLKGNLDTAVKGLSEQLQQIADNTKSLNAENIGDSLKKLSGDISGLSTKIAEMIDKFKETSNTVNAEMLETMKASLTKLNETMAAMLKIQTEETDKNIKKMTDLLKNMEETMKNIFRDMVKANQEQIEINGKDRENTNIMVKDTLKELMAQIAQQMEGMRTMLKDHEEHFEKTLNEMKEAVDASGKVVAATGQVMDKAKDTAVTWDNMADTTSSKLENAAISASSKLESAAGTIKDSAEPFKKAVEPLAQSTASINGSLKTLGTAIEVYNTNTKKTLDQLEAMVKNSQSETTNILQALRMTKEQFQEINKAMEESFKTLDDGIERYNNITDDGLRKKLGIFDESVANIVNKLAALNGETNELLDDMTDAIKKLNNSIQRMG